MWMLLLTKGDYFRIGVLVFLAIAIPNFNALITPMITADVAVSQLQDSDTAYAGFKALKYAPTVLWTIFGAHVAFTVYKIFNK